MMIVNKKIGDMTKSELKDFIVELQEENSRYERLNQKYKEVIDKAIEKLEEVKERRIMLLDEEKVLEILKEVE